MKDDKGEYPKKNGLKCPNCEEELLDSDKMVLYSSPLKKNVHCENCGYRGYRIFGDFEC